MSKPELIIDECLLSKKLIHGLNKAGIKYKTFPVGTQDIDIIKYMYFNNAMIVTEDVDLCTHFNWDRSLLLSSKDPNPDKIRVIKAFIDKQEDESLKSPEQVVRT